MPNESTEQKTKAPATPVPPHQRVAAWTERVWRPASTVVVVLLALFLTWHVIYGKHGLSVWRRMREQDRRLQHQIQQLRRQNADMQKQVQQLQSDPDAIEREAREKLHYAKPGEVIYALPDAPQPGK